MTRCKKKEKLEEPEVDSNPAHVATDTPAAHTSETPSVDNNMSESSQVIAENADHDVPVRIQMPMNIKPEESDKGNAESIINN